MLRAGHRLEITVLHLLDAGDILDRDARGEERILAVGLLPAAPARIAKDVDVGRPETQPVIGLAAFAVTDGLVILGPGLVGDDLPDLVDQRRVPRRGHADGLRKNGGVTFARHAVQGLAPVVVGGDLQAREGRGGVDELRRLLGQRHAGDEIVDARVHRLGGIGVDLRRGHLGNLRRRGVNCLEVGRWSGFGRVPAGHGGQHQKRRQPDGEETRKSSGTRNRESGGHDDEGRPVKSW
jgi:hypothetical protein